MRPFRAPTLQVLWPKLTGTIDEDFICQMRVE
jgi:hypothetical protein